MIGTAFLGILGFALIGTLMQWESDRKSLREANREIRRLKDGVHHWQRMAISHSEALRSYKRDRSLACSRAAKIGVAKRAKQKAEA